MMSSGTRRQYRDDDRRFEDSGRKRRRRAARVGRAVEPRSGERAARAVHRNSSRAVPARDFRSDPRALRHRDSAASVAERNRGRTESGRVELVTVRQLTVCYDFIPTRMFETVVPETVEIRSRRLLYATLPLSIAVHILALGGLALTTLWNIAFPTESPPLAPPYSLSPTPPPPPPPPPPPRPTPSHL